MSSPVAPAVKESSVKPSGRRRLTAENRREQILATAATLFTERGFEGVSMTDIAQELQTSRPTIYTYFPSTESILDTLLDERLQHLPERLAPYLRPVAPDQITSFTLIFKALLDERELLLLLNSGGGPYFRSRRRAFLDAIAKRLHLQEWGQQNSKILGRVREPLLLPIVLNLLVGLAYEQITQGDLDAGALAAVLDQFIVSGIQGVLD